MIKKIILPLVLVQILFGQGMFEKGQEEYDYVESLMNVKMTEKMKGFQKEYDSGNQHSGYLLANELYQNGYYTQSGEILTSLITEKDVPEAFTLLGEQFLYGKGVKKDCLKAGLFFSGGVSAGDCNAYMKIHNQYVEGACVEKNNYKAKKYLKANKICLKNQAAGIVKAKKIDNKMVIQ